MRSLISKLSLERLRAIFGSTSSDQTVETSKPVTVASQEAVALAEAMICDAITHCCDRSQNSAENSVGNLSSLNAFGKQVQEMGNNGVSGTIASAGAISLTGLRSAAFFSGDRLSESQAQIQSLANRHTPLVLHPIFREGSGLGSSHSSYHEVADLGMFQILPHSTQQAVDYVLLARWLAERTLVPGLVGIDRHTVEQVVFPSADLVREFIGAPTESLVSPTPAQLLLFGGERPLIPRWFDLDRPVSFDSVRGSNDGASAVVGRQSFSWDKGAFAHSKTRILRLLSRFWAINSAGNGRSHVIPKTPTLVFLVERR